MEKTVVPTVTELAKGVRFTAKQMQAKAGEKMPEHQADRESILFIHKGECSLRMENGEFFLKSGDAINIPSFVKHQITAITEYKGIHFMPRDIKFEFFKQ